MKHRGSFLLLPVLLVLLALPTLAGCGDDGGDGSVPVFQGQLGGDYELPLRAGLLDKVLDVVLGGTARASGGSIVDTAVLLSTTDDTRFESTIDARGNFSFTFDREVAGSWLVILVCSDAPIEERVAGYVTMGAGSDTMLAFPPLDAPLDVGTLSRTDDEATSSLDVSETEDSFTLSLEDLLAVAATDDSYKFIINRYLNFDPETGVFYDPKVAFLWHMPFAEGTDGPIPLTATPDALHYSGYTLDVGTNDPSFPEDGICDGSVELALRPPTGVVTATAVVYGPDRPLLNDELDSGGSYCAHATRVSPDGGGNLSLFFGEGLLRGVAEGYWTLAVAGETRAAFDLGVTDPNRGDLIRVPVPMPRVTTDAAGVVQSLSIDWYLSIRDGYVQHARPEALALTVYDLVVTFDHADTQDVYRLGSPVDGVTSLDNPIVLGGVPGSEGVNSDKMGITYRIGPVQYAFSFGRDDYQPGFSITAPPGNVQVVRPLDTGTEASIRILLDPPSPETVTFDYATSDGTATLADGDYAEVSGTVTFAPGESSQTLTLAIPPAGVLQPDETFYVDFTNSSGPALDTARVEVVLRSPVRVSFVGTFDGDGLVAGLSAPEGEDLVLYLDVDPPAPFQIDAELSLEAPSYLAERFSIATAGVDYDPGGGTVVRIPPMTARAELRIPTFEDVEDEADEVVVVSFRPDSGALTNATFEGPRLVGLHIRDREPGFWLEGPGTVPEGGVATFTLTTATPPVAPLSLRYTAVTLGRPGPSDPTMRTVTFPAGADSVEFSVDVADDSTATGDYVLIVTLDEYVRGTVTYPRQSILVSVADDDVGLGPSECRYALDSRPTWLQRVTMTRFGLGSGAPVLAPVQFETRSGSATEGVDFLRTTETVELADGDTHHFFVPILTDDLGEGDETYEVRVTAAGAEEIITCHILY